MNLRNLSLEDLALYYAGASALTDKAERAVTVAVALAELRRRQALLDAVLGANRPELEGEWEVAEYDDQQIEILGNKEIHVAFLNNSTTGKRFGRYIVAVHNAAYAAGCW